MSDLQTNLLGRKVELTSAVTTSASFADWPTVHQPGEIVAVWREPTNGPFTIGLRCTVKWADGKFMDLDLSQVRIVEQTGNPYRTLVTQTDLEYLATMMTICAGCGLTSQKTDEDGCCLTCGADRHQEGVHILVKELEAERDAAQKDHKAMEMLRKYRDIRLERDGVSFFASVGKEKEHMNIEDDPAEAILELPEEKLEAFEEATNEL